VDRDWFFEDPGEVNPESEDRHEDVHPDPGHTQSGAGSEHPDDDSDNHSSVSSSDFSAAVTPTRSYEADDSEDASQDDLGMVLNTADSEPFSPEPELDIESEDEPVWEAPLGGLESVRELLYRGDEAVLILPAEVFVHFYPAAPEQVINAILAAGFRALHFESLGDELVALEYLRLWRENSEKRTWIRSTSPLVVEYCQAKHPQLLPYLAPIAPPAVALARYLRCKGESAEHLVYAGLDVPEVNGERQFSAALSFLDLERLLEERGAGPHEQPLLLQQLPPERRRFLSTAGGLPLPMLDEERASSRHFRTTRGLHTLAAFARLVEEGGAQLGFIDVLPFDGALDHPALGPHEQLYWRRDILELAEPERASGPVIDVPEDLDLSVSYGPKPTGLPAEEVGEIERALEEVQLQANGVVWNHAGRDYAGYLSLAESLMRRRPDLAVGLLHMSRNYFRAVRDATHDALTDLYSYRALVQRAREELGQANRAGASLAMLFVDLDNFKEINDRYGHPVGNDILRQVARSLEVAIRSTDIAGRFGGDEFVVLLVDADFDGAVRVADEIRQNVANIRVSVPDGEVGTSASIGIAAHAGSEDSLLTADDLFAEADAALYIAKAHGGNRVHPVVREGTPQ
jgi:diguanylate cyclase (GGDEF)-like protein